MTNEFLNPTLDTTTFSTFPQAIEATYGVKISMNEQLHMTYLDDEGSLIAQCVKYGAAGFALEQGFDANGDYWLITDKPDHYFAVHNKTHKIFVSGVMAPTLVEKKVKYKKFAGGGTFTKTVVKEVPMASIVEAGDFHMTDVDYVDESQNLVKFTFSKV